MTQQKTVALVLAGGAGSRPELPVRFKAKSPWNRYFGRDGYHGGYGHHREQGDGTPEF